MVASMKMMQSSSPKVAKVQLVYVIRVWDCKKAKQYLPSLKTLQSDARYGHKKLMQLIERPTSFSPKLQ